LKWKGSATGVVFGFLKAIDTLKERFATERLAFCFEGKDLKRKEIFKDYKLRRTTKTRTPEEQEAYEGMVRQIAALRTKHLPEIGYRNIFTYPGFESDDIMAALTDDLEDENDQAVLVTGDHDLYQCLRPNVSVYSPHQLRLVTDRSFRTEYGISPSKWALVKALAGCNSDNVPGIRGVGEATALRFVQRELPKDCKIYQLIMSEESKALVRRNRSLVQLPFAGCPTPKLVSDKVSGAGFMKVCKTLGMSAYGRGARS